LFGRYPADDSLTASVVRLKFSEAAVENSKAVDHMQKVIVVGKCLVIMP
jgi:hypothetical protein